MTGTITRSGRIGPVAGLEEKTKTAAVAGYKVLLVPKGESVITTYRAVGQRSAPFGYFTHSQCERSTLNLSTIAGDMEIREVATINEALEQMLVAE